ncbi:hypothetical protein NC99_44510 [Sunxiuqinia dokdonensis]|uniref:Uncharacterized protein n=1 Tax=Sunxiuqinia dokdonensis TaxID=1409788 RepID=A0A0L8V2K8_9BACT|nr:hypothetical protein NC99_44510 [Sunxiuqinia dokdonensis]
MVLSKMLGCAVFFIASVLPLVAPYPAVISNEFKFTNKYHVDYGL